MSDLLELLGAEVRGVDPWVYDRAEGGWPLEAALEGADAVTVHCNLTDSSRGLLDAEALALLPPHAVVVNTLARFIARFLHALPAVEAELDRMTDSYAQAIEALDTAALVESFHRFRPLMEQAYGYLGYKPENLDNAIVRALDTIIAAPVVNETLPVKKVEAIYKFADPELETLPDIQKQLLRMGPENTRRIQSQAKALRAALLVPPE